MGSYRSSVSKSKYAPPPAEGEGMIAVHEDAHADTNGAKIVVGDGRVNPAAAYIPDPVKEWKEVCKISLHPNRHLLLCCPPVLS